ncbi:hypothetical protein CsSME_00017430 [Camellia sinensis var. sinensis]
MRTNQSLVGLYKLGNITLTRPRGGGRAWTGTMLL